MGFIEYFFTAFGTLPLAIWDCGDLAISIYKYTLHDTPVGIYGTRELLIILIFGCLKFPVAIACIVIWCRAYGNVRQKPCCDSESQEEWTKANAVMQVPKFLTSICDIVLLVCNVRILGNMTADGLSADPSSLYNGDAFHSLVGALYVSIVMEVSVEVVKALSRIGSIVKSAGCDCLTCTENQGKGSGWGLVAELALLGMAFACLRISFDFQLLQGISPDNTKAALYAIAVTNFVLGFFYVAFRFLLGQIRTSADNNSLRDYLGCGTPCGRDDLDCMSLALFVIVAPYLLLSAILAATILGVGYPDQGTIFQTCTIATMIISGFLLFWLIVARILACCCGHVPGPRGEGGPSTAVALS